MNNGLESEWAVGSSVAGRYRLLEVLGSGGAGTVYRVIDEFLKREVALKVLHGHLTAHQEFGQGLREAQVLVELNHAGIVQVFDVGEFAGRVFLVMELLRGHCLTDEIEEARREGVLMEQEYACDVTIQVARALAHAHSKGIIHLDVKPGNIVILDSLGPVVAKVLDFGICTRLVGGSSSTVSPVCLSERGFRGTLAYCSPEQKVPSEELGPYSDIYSLALVFYEMLSGGELPGGVTPVSEVNQFVAKGIDRALTKALSWRVEKRYAAMDEFIADLSHFSTLRLPSWR